MITMITVLNLLPVVIKEIKPKNVRFDQTFLVSGEWLAGDGPDLSIYSVHLCIERDVDGLALRLPNAPSDGIWIFSVVVGSSRKRTTTTSATFNLANVDAMIGGAELTDRAKDFKKMFEGFQRSKDTSSGGDGLPAMGFGGLLAAAMAAGGKGLNLPPGLGESTHETLSVPIPSDIQSRLAELSLTSAQVKSEDVSGDKIKDAVPTSSPNTTGELRTLSSDLHAMEARIMARIEEVRREQNEKMDRIENMLRQIKIHCHSGDREGES